MQIIALDHVQLAMPEGQEQKARDFYGSILGFAEVPKPENLAARGGCWFENGAIRLHLGVEHPFTPARKAHPAFLVADLHEMIAHLTRAGIETIVDEPLQGYERCYIHDPFGNRIELMQKIA
ncbi:glyoxalase [Brucella tritici]|uniref:Glyoxalase n=1 Tax=Brucella tritici TaxID=94626 RepID=A0A6L3YDD9_9HYPH|nr:VOC family protein [Brucella tritici]KAB2666821.1 glyoxalase [Brucella tritici]KAB2681420.1 glyoxalase [Brucella tritici]MBJ6720073.1 VOC family protein [Bacillus sp. PR5]